MYRKLFAALFTLLALAFSAHAQALRDDYDVVVAGGGTGGTAAAIQASRMGMNVLVVESTGMLGGQATAAGVSTMDDLSGQMSGLYREFMERVEEYYASRGKSITTCYWDAQNKAFEPRIGSRILADMARGEDAPDILYRSRVVGVGTEDVIAVSSGNMSSGKRVNSVIIQTPQGKINIACKVLIDATEYGDVIPMTGAAYRAGNSVTPNISNDAMIQDITWTAIMRKYPDGVPPHLKPRTPLPSYDLAKFNYREYVTRDGATFKGVYPVEQPVNFAAHNAYRGLPDTFLPGNFTSDSGNWDECTKTSVNWGNDYPGQYMWGKKYGLPVAYLEDAELRARVERDALIKTLHFIYYVQNELGESWSVDEDEYNELPEAAKDLPDEWKEIARHMPPIPYVRESRRIVGDRTLTSEELFRNSQSYRDGNHNNEFSNAIAIGRYSLDLHHAREDSDMDMDEKEEYMTSRFPAGNFQVPLDVLIPQNVDGFLAAEKNISVSRLAAGALRLQPITMMTGQAAGALAALSVLGDTQPREVKAIRVQSVLLDAGVDLSLCRYIDVPGEHKYYASVQLANLYGLLEPLSYPGENEAGEFGIDELVTSGDIARLRERAKVAVPSLTENMTRGEAVDLAVKAMEK
ncbi:MAG: FAD-dependent oxidoreductase [Synergistaceae bacterium]|nr:FAD-dependent oxidoreductase [Synergistaceae bacterium]